ncbi:MAG: helix-turn-helix domain-containing protein [Ruminococcaceae bacterium]|nr:helix-turn-helix domain-containing protein [Oscillospiraceae bacterium]
MNRDRFHSSNIGYEMYDSLSVSDVFYNNGKQGDSICKTFGSYRLHFITSGNVQLRYGESSEMIKAGEAVFVPPFSSAELKGENFEVITIFARGVDLGKFAEKYGFYHSLRIFSGLDDMIALYNTLKGLNHVVSIMRAKGLIYYTLSEISRISGIGCGLQNAFSVGEQIKMYIDKNFALPDMSLKTIAATLSYHPNYISKMFNESYGISVSRYVNILRIRHARQLMEEGQRSIKEISEICGFSDEDYFAMVFKKQLGETPREYFKKIKNGGASL